MSYRSTTLLFTASLLVLAAMPAAAQTAPADGEAAAPAPDYHDDIIVTARRTAENQQDVPMSLTAISGDTLREQNVTMVSDLTRLVPSLNFSTDLNRNNVTFAMRGQRETRTSPGTGGGPAVVAYFAEAPSRAIGPGQFFDMQNVQVLKGPQGTLFGQNTTGGAILFEPQRPKNEFEGYVMGTVGSYGRLDIEGAVNIPIVDDKLLFRVGGQTLNRNGFTHDAVTGKDYDDRNAWSVRASLLFRPSGSFENYTVVQFAGSRENGPGVVLIAANPKNVFASFLTPLLAQQQARGVRNVALSAISRDRTRQFGVINRTTLNLSDDLTLTNIFSYTNYRTDSARDDDGTPLPIQDSNGAWKPGTWNTNFNYLTEELRLSGTLGGGLVKFQAGGYYDHLTPGGVMTYSQNLQTVATSSQVDSTARSTSKALFGQVGFDVGKVVPALEGLNLTAGYRYTWNDFAFGITLLQYPGILRPPPEPQAGTPCLVPPGNVYPNCGVSGSGKDRGDSFAFGADYKIGRDVMIFANYKRGYKPGGFNPTVAAFGGSPSDPFYSFKSETVNTTEVGLKTSWSLAGLRGRFNVTGYSSRYRNIHANVPAIVPPFTATAIQNAARATIRGMEVEANVSIRRWFSIDAGYSYTDAKYDQYLVAGTDPSMPPLDLSALPFVFTPKNQFNIGANLTLPTPKQFGDLVLRGTYSWQDRIYAGDTDPTQPFSTIKGYGLLGARIDWQNVLDTKNVDLALFATNLTNKTYRIAIIQQYNASGYTSAIYGEPRMFGASLRIRY
ncbi:TonB-dependent receptor [Sphingomonas sp.]|uniref:TonB-dependent receptor n=1 Tax=Sphingomonas sp. TaxID=28214 RepID=UPI003D6D6826